MITLLPISHSACFIQDVHAVLHTFFFGRFWNVARRDSEEAQILHELGPPRPSIAWLNAAIYQHVGDIEVEIPVIPFLQRSSFAFARHHTMPHWSNPLEISKDSGDYCCSICFVFCVPTTFLTMCCLSQLAIAPIVLWRLPQSQKLAGGATMP
jgi:hypothetical protein